VNYRRKLIPGIFLLFLFVAFGCTAWGEQKLEKQELVLQGAEKSVTIKVEIAKTDEERSRGLMFRKSLADGEGMLFVFERDQPLSFWMKNTLIPLSIAYISSDGRIMEIRDMEPGNLDPVRSSRSVRYALEVPQGWFGRVNLGIGDRLILNHR
jgi:uncharacterized membrane protein (UPF0127 family)